MAPTRGGQQLMTIVPETENLAKGGRGVQNR